MNAQKKNEAFDTVYDALFPDVFAYFNVCFGAQEAEDLAQEIFLRVWRAIQDGKTPDNWRAWVFRCAVNLKNDFLRRAYAARETQPLDEAQQDLSAAPDDMTRLAVQRAFAALPKDCAELLTLKSFGFKSEEIGTMLGVTASAVRTRLQKAKGLFSECLEREAKTDEPA